MRNKLRVRNVSLFISGLISFVTAMAHALPGQAHLSRILETSTEAIDSAVIFAVWHMATIVFLTFAIGLLLLPLRGKSESVRMFSLFSAVLFCLFGVVFLFTQTLYGEPTIQWIPMLLISVFSLIGHLNSDNPDHRVAQEIT